MRTIDDSLDPKPVAEIDARLARIVTEEGVTIPWAIESGSRAWGFPSPDSDYDCRFLYVRPLEHYLSLHPRRDVIETPLDPIIDANGWDVTKALRLMLKGNATPGEWLRSPLVYSGETGFRDRMLAFADEIHDAALTARHYRHVAERQLALAHADGRLKRLFYALRPAATLRWLRESGSSGVPPMDLPTLLDESAVADSHRAEIEELIARKAVTKELGTGAYPPRLLAFVAEEVDQALARWGEPEHAVRPGALDAADALLRELLGL